MAVKVLDAHYIADFYQTEDDRLSDIGNGVSKLLSKRFADL